MAIEFPANKFVNDTFDYGGMTYVWDGEKWTASGAAAFEDVYVNKDGDTMTGDLTVPSLNGGPLAGMRNVLINGNFSVWQRGEDQSFTGSTPENYGADRWFVRAPNSVGASSIEFKKVDDGAVSKARIVFNGSPSSKCFCSQRVEAANIKGHYGKEMTLSFHLENVSMSTAPTPTVTVISYNSADAGKTIVAEGTAIPNVDGTKYSVTFTYDTTDGTVNSDNERGLLVSININGSSAVSAGACQLWNVQLEPGPVATPVEIRPIGLEEQLCARYFYRFEMPSGKRLNIMFWNRSASLATNAVNCTTTPLSFPVVMRATPTSTPFTAPTTLASWRIGVFDNQTNTSGATIGTPSQISGQYVTRESFSLITFWNTGDVTGAWDAQERNRTQMTFVRNGSANTVPIDFSAEL